MGLSGSKNATKAVGSAARQYPSRPSPAITTQYPHERLSNKPGHVGPTVQPKPYAAGSRDEAIRKDAADPDFDAESGLDPQLAASLHAIGPVKPLPTYSPSAITSTNSNERYTLRTPPNMFSNPAMISSTSSTASPTSSTRSSVPRTPALNPSVVILQSRKRIEEEALAETEALEMGQKLDGGGKRYVDVHTLRRAMILRDQENWDIPRIEKELKVRRGVLKDALGVKGVVALIDDRRSSVKTPPAAVGAAGTGGV